MDPFHFVSHAQDIHFGPGSLARLSEIVTLIDGRRLLLCTSRSMRANGHLAKIEALLGERLALAFDHVLPHVQDVQLAELLSVGLDRNVDAVIGLGGGSSIGMAKALASALGQAQAGQPAGAAAVTDPPPLIPVIAIPGTYAGSEMTAVYGVTHTDETPPRKVTINDPRITPAFVLYDPELTLDLPPEVTASTGINALAHCIEALYSTTRNPLSSAAATAGVRHISHALLRCHRLASDRSLTPGQALADRSEMLLGAHLAGFALASVSMGLHHGLCHVLGGTANIPHGVANAIILPHAIRFNAAATAVQLLPAAEAIGLPGGTGSAIQIAQELAGKIFELIGEMNLPQRLRDAGVALHQSDLPGLARLAFQNRTVQNNPTPITEVSQIEALLQAAW